MKIIFRKIITNKIIISTVLSTFIYITLTTTGVLPTYHLFSWIIYPLLIMMFYKSNLYNYPTFKASVIFSMIFGFIMFFGERVYTLQDLNNISILENFFSVKNLLITLSNSAIIYLILVNFIPFLVNFKMNPGKLNSSKKIYYSYFFISFFIILICWLPYYLAMFPGSLSPDSVSEFMIISSDFKSMSDHHPIFHVFFMSIPYTIGVILFDSTNTGIALTSALQSILMSAIFAYSVSFLYKQKVNKYFIYILVGCYALLPMHGFYSVTMWKDVLFAGSFLLLTIECIKLLQEYQTNTVTIKTTISFTIVSLICVFLRNNAIYMYAFLAVTTLLMMRKYYKILIIPFVIVFVTYSIIKGPGFDYLAISRSSSSEYIGIPLQQIGRMTFKNAEFNEQQEELLNDLMPFDLWENAYRPWSSDGIKFNKNYNSEAFDENVLKYTTLWLELISEYPVVAFEAYATSTLGYWYPNLSHWSVASGVWWNDLGIYEDSKVSKNIKELLLKIESREFPIVTITWSIGLWFWLLAILIYSSVKRGHIINLYPFLPSIGIWLTMMVASPVYGEFRYVYCVISTIPLLFISTLTIKKDLL